MLTLVKLHSVLGVSAGTPPLAEVVAGPQAVASITTGSLIGLLAGGLALGLLLGWGVMRRRLLKVQRDLAEQSGQATTDRRLGEQQEPVDLHDLRIDAVKIWVADIAHSFNNLLTNVVGCVELIRIQDETGTFSELTDSVVESSQQATSLCRHLQVAVGSKSMDRESCDLCELVRDTLPTLQAAVSSSLDIQMSGDSQSATVYADRKHLVHVLLSLASSYEQSGASCVTVKTMLVDPENGDDRSAVLEFVGDGEVLLPECAEGELRPGSYGEVPGRALSLAIVIAGVKRHGGRVFASRVSGGRSCLSISLPLKKAHGGGFAQPRTQPAAKQGSAEVAGEAVESLAAAVIIVDDERIVRLSLKNLLTHLKIDASEFESGQDAIAFVEAMPAGQSCIALIDLTMPGMNGEEVVRRLHGTERPVECVLMSGHASGDVAELARKLGVERILTKPFALEDVEQVLRGLAGNMKVGE